MAVGALALGGAFLLDSYHLRVVKNTRESSAASLSLDERVEQLRIATWQQITNSEYLKQSYFATVPKSISPLDGYSERISIAAWPQPEVCQPLTVEKKKGASAQVLSAGAGLEDQRVAKIDVHISWKSSGGRIRTREMTTIISNAGISRMNLPAMGGAAGGSQGGEATEPVGTGTEDKPSSAPGTDASSDATAPPPSETAPAGPGRGRGRGNVGGKPGKG